jgi:DnaJ homolog subfamily C member 2
LINSDRKKVLKHHPDKKAGAVGDSNDDAFFKCIQKANDTLTHPEKRRQFDSVDPYYDLLEADVPTAQQVTKSKDPNLAFFKLFSPVFEREARFSRQQPVPLLGEYADAKERVEAFYHFWYNFDSWRSFEYLDKEVNEGSDKYVPFFPSRVTTSLTSTFSRDDKRYTEKKNKAERARRKKEDTARLRNIVDVALSVDPRIKRIKQEEKEEKEAKRKNKAGAGGGLSKAEIEEEKRRAEEEAKVKEEAEKVCLCTSFTASIGADDFCRLLGPRRRRRRPLLLMPRKRHDVLREPTPTLLELHDDVLQQ